MPDRTSLATLAWHNSRNEPRAGAGNWEGRSGSCVRDGALALSDRIPLPWWAVLAAAANRTASSSRELMTAPLKAVRSGISRMRSGRTERSGLTQTCGLATSAVWCRPIFRTYLKPSDTSAPKVVLCPPVQRWRLWWRPGRYGELESRLCPAM